jgi:hypothetical protein
MKLLLIDKVPGRGNVVAMMLTADASWVCKGKLIKAHIAPAGSNGVIGGGDGRLVTLVVKWHGWNEAYHHWATMEGATQSRRHKPCIGVYVGRCNKVVGSESGSAMSKGEESTWDVLELVRYEGNGRVADSVRHFGQLVSQSLVGSVMAVGVLE